MEERGKDYLLVLPFEAHPIFPCSCGRKTRRKIMICEMYFSFFFQWYRLLLQHMFERVSWVYDVSTDVLVMIQFARAGQTFLAMYVFIALFSPYIVCWTASLRVMAEQESVIVKTIYAIPFGGIILLMGLDVFLILEAVVLNPMYFLCGRKVYDYSRAEYGYLRLRAMSELVLENIPQVALQVCVCLADWLSFFLFCVKRIWGLFFVFSYNVWGCVMTKLSRVFFLTKSQKNLV